MSQPQRVQVKVHQLPRVNQLQRAPAKVQARPRAKLKVQVKRILIALARIQAVVRRNQKRVANQILKV